MNYSQTRFQNKKELFDWCIDVSDCYYSQTEHLETIRNIILNPLNLEIAKPTAVRERERERDLIKYEIETMLEEYDLEKIAKFNLSLNHFVGYIDEFKEKEIQVWELIYWYVFNDQHGFHSELIRTDLDTLKAIEFI